MYRKRIRPIEKIKTVALIALAVVLLCSVVGVTLAYLIDKTENVTNTFSPSEVVCEIDEDFEQNVSTVKKDVTVKNTGEIPAYIRAAIVVTWVSDEDGSVSSELPVKGTDYTIDINTSDWFEVNGYYYFDTSVASNSSTEKLINTCTVVGTKDGYHLSVEILAQAIQAQPDAAVKDAWQVVEGEWDAENNSGTLSQITGN